MAVGAVARVHRWLAAAILVTLVAEAAPAAAGTDTQSDPADDVVTVEDEPADDPLVDILSVAVDNELERVVVTIGVAEVLPFTDDAWSEGMFLLGSGFRSPRTGTTWSWLGAVSDVGDPVGVLTATDEDEGTSSSACATEFDATATSYVLTATGPCAAALARSIEHAAVALRFEVTTATFEATLDAAPDQPSNAEDDIYFAAVGTEGSAGGPERLAGVDRMATAIALSQDLHADATAPAVVLAAAHTFPDALAGGPLASYLHAPVLLTDTTHLNPRTHAEIDRVLSDEGTVYVLGGTAAISNAVLDQLATDEHRARRVAGANRFETAVAVAEEIDAIADVDGVILLADGRSDIDAVLAAAAAPHHTGVVLLTDGTTMPTSTANWLAGNTREPRYAIGNAAAQAAPDATAITGSSPAALSVRVSDVLAPIGGTVAVAADDAIVDALAGGPHIAAHLGVLLLTDGTTLSTETRDALEDARADLRKVVVYGGTSAVTADVEADIGDAMRS